MGFFSRIFGRRKRNHSFMDSPAHYVPRCVKNGSKGLGLKPLEDFDIGKVNKRNKYEKLKQEVKYLRQTTGLSIMVLESEVAQLQEQLDTILRQRARLWEEMRQLKEQYGMHSASSEPQSTSREFGSTFH